MNEPAISIAMTTYNGERYLREQLDSFARQTLLPCELVACDDGSTDATLDILYHFAAKASFPVRTYQNEKQLGYGPNFLRAASLCSGSLIAFSDQDDVWLEHKLERCAAAISETGSNLVVHSAEVVDEQLVPMGSQTSRVRSRIHLDAEAGKRWSPLRGRMNGFVSPVKGFTCVFRSRLLRQIPPAPPVAGPNIGHETWLLFAAEGAGSIALISDVLALYRQHGNNVKGFRKSVPPKRDIAADLMVGKTVYSRQAEIAGAYAGILADAAERSPEMRPRLARAQNWYQAQADSLARRVALYTEASSLREVAPRLLWMALSGDYRRRTRGGLGIQGLVKDLFMPVVQRAVEKRRRARRLSPCQDTASGERVR